MTPSPLANTLAECQALDEQDPLRSLRDLFQLPEGVIYLDGNSLGVLPKATPARVAAAVNQAWGQDLIKSWNSAGWFHMPLKVGDKIAKLIGAGEDPRADRIARRIALVAIAVALAGVAWIAVDTVQAINHYNALVQANTVLP